MTCVLQDSITAVVKTWEDEPPAFGPGPGTAVAAQALFHLLPKNKYLLISCCFSLLGAASPGFVTAHPFRTESPPCCQEMQGRQSTPNSLWKTLLSSSPVNLSINGNLLIPLFFVLKSFGLPRHWLINYEIVLRALVRCAMVLHHSFL